MSGEILILVLRIIMGSGLLLIGAISVRRLYLESSEGDKRGFGAHIRKYFVSYLMIIIGLYILIKGF